jgi:cytochrome c biogenesis protein CcdA
MALAAMVNLVELGCTFILPMAYLETLISSYPNDAFSHILYTAFYAAVYVIPLFAILGSFIYAFKSERMTEKQARVLKLLGGGLMVVLGLILLFKPELLVFG